MKEGQVDILGWFVGSLLWTTLCGGNWSLLFDDEEHPSVGLVVLVCALVAPLMTLLIWSVFFYGASVSMPAQWAMVTGYVLGLVATQRIAHHLFWG
jgi:hypothetical protein